MDANFEETLKLSKSWTELEAMTGCTKIMLIKHIEKQRLDASHLPAIDESICTALPRKMVLKYCSKGVGQVDIESFPI